MDPAVHRDLMALVYQGALLFGMQGCGHGGDEERRPHVVLAQRGANALNADAAAVFTPTQARERSAAVAQFIGLVIRVERQRYSSARPVLPRRWPQSPPCPHATRQPAPMRLLPLPGFHAAHPC